MRIRRAVPFATIPLLLAAGCGGGEDAPPADDDPPITAEEIRQSAPLADTGSRRAPGADTTAGPAGEPGPGPRAEADTDRTAGAAATRTAESTAGESGEAAPRTRTFYAVQVGAFARADNSDTLEATLVDAGLPAWTSPARVDGRSVRRVRVGATDSYQRARDLNRRLREQVGTEGIVVSVPPEESIPGGVVASTRRLLDQG